MKKSSLTITIIIVILLILSIWIWLSSSTNKTPTPVTTFEECLALGGPIMEIYPRQCRAGDETFTENVGNEMEKMDLVTLTTPRPNQKIKSPLVIKGQARGNWLFEDSFPIFLVDWDGRIISQGIATAKPVEGGTWMTTEFVPFEAELEFTVERDIYSNRGSLILKKDNASGLPEHDDALEIPIVFDME